jgi:hypothetical protein
MAAAIDFVLSDRVGRAIDCSALEVLVNSIVSCSSQQTTHFEIVLDISSMGD